MDGWGDDRGGRVGAHAAGVGTGIAVTDVLVILAGGQRQNVLAIGHDDEAGFFAFQILFNDDPCIGCGEQRVNGAERFVKRFGDDYALACRESVGLDDDRRALLFDVGMGGGDIAESDEGGGGDLVAHHEAFGKILGAFELRGFLGRAKDFEAARAKEIDDARRQRHFRADNGQVDAVLFGKVGELDRVGDRQVFQFKLTCRAGVARCDIDLLQAGGFSQMPGQRVFAPTGANDE